MHTKSIFDLQKYFTAKCLNKIPILCKHAGFGKKTKVDVTDVLGIQKYFPVL